MKAINCTVYELLNELDAKCIVKLYEGTEEANTNIAEGKLYKILSDDDLMTGCGHKNVIGLTIVMGLVQVLFQ